MVLGFKITSESATCIIVVVLIGPDTANCGTGLARIALYTWNYQCIVFAFKVNLSKMKNFTGKTQWLGGLFTSHANAQSVRSGIPKNPRKSAVNKYVLKNLKINSALPTINANY